MLILSKKKADVWLLLVLVMLFNSIALILIWLKKMLKKAVPPKT